MEYELLVETSPAEWVRVDLGSETPAMVFQVNDLGELATRKSSYSQTLKLPLTANNRKIFGFANEFTVKSQVPYVTRKCVLYLNGLVVAGTAFRLELRAISDTFECQITSNVRDLFSVLGGLSMADNTDFAAPFTWSHVDVSARNNVSADVATLRRYFAANTVVSETPGAWGLRSEFPRYDTLQLDADGKQYMTALCAHVYPYYSILETLRVLLSAQGYALETDLNELAGYRDAYFSLPKLVAGEDSFAPLEKPAYSPGVTIAADTIFPVAITGSDSNVTSTSYYSEWAHQMMWDPAEVSTDRIYSWEYTSPGALQMAMGIRIWSDRDDDIVDGRARVVVWKAWKGGVFENGSNVFSEIIMDEPEVFASRTTSLQPPLTTDVFNICPGERVYVSVMLNSGTIGRTFRPEITPIINYEDNRVCPGGDVYPGLSTGFSTQLDFVKFVVNAYGLLVDVDDNRKVLRAYTFNNFYGRVTAGDYADWSGKMDASKIGPQTFSIANYAQENRIALTDNRLLPRSDWAAILVGNSNLENSKTLFTLPFEAAHGTETEVSQRYLYDSNDKRFLPNPAYDAAPTIYLPRIGVADAAVHVVTWSADYPADRTEEFRMIPQRPAIPGITELPLPLPFAAPLPAEYFVNNFYASITRILNPARVIDAYFNLTEIDIANLDILRPVYIDAYGDYFYIQKIDNYIANRLTRCTLVCLNLTNE